MIELHRTLACIRVKKDTFSNCNLYKKSNSYFCMQPGDTIKVFTKTEVLEGTYLEKPALLAGDTVVLKLENGYNIGIKKDDITSMKVIEEKKEKKTKKKSLPHNPKLKNIVILSTGGTIASKVDYTTGGVVAAYTAEDFVEMCPELADIANISTVQVMQAMSENITSEEWKQIAQATYDALAKADGVVVTMGTDTLGYIAAALSFAVRPDKPVIITAAQKSIDRGSSDAFFNLLCAVRAATDWKGKEVAVCMHGTSGDEYCSLLRGTKTRKIHSSRRDAFKSINLGPLANVTPEKVEELLPTLAQKKGLHNHFSNEVALLYAYPDMDATLVEACKNKKGVILMGTGLGHIPETIHDAVKALVDAGVFVGMTTQTLYGRVSPTVYSNLRKVSIGLGVTYLEDMLPETAFVKLKWVLGKTEKIEEVKNMMLTNEVGEINDRHDVDDFLFST